jgi:hypothetical protein
MCEASGKTVRADEYDFLPKYKSEIERLKLAKTSFEAQIPQLQNAHDEYSLKMIDFRTSQRDWEVELLEAVHKAGQSPMYDDGTPLLDDNTMDKIRSWAKQENQNDNDHKYDTFYFGDAATLDKRPVYPWQWNRSRGPPLPLYIPQRLRDLRAAIVKVEGTIADLTKRQTRSMTQGNKNRVYLQALSDSDDEEENQISLPTDLTDYIAWVAQRHGAWDAERPPDDQDLIEKYGLPDILTSDQTTWPQAMKSLGITPLRIDEDLKVYPWGKPALALQRTLARAPGYTKDAMFTEVASKVLCRIEHWYFTQSVPNRKALSSTGIDHWKLTIKGKKGLMDALVEVNAKKESHPTLFP